MKKLGLMFLVAAVSSVVAGCAADASTEDDAVVDAALEQAFADGSFRATVKWLEGEGVEVDLPAAAYHLEDDGRETVRIPLSGGNYQFLGYAFVEQDALDRVFTKQLQVDVPEAPQATCAVSSGYDYCDFGPWLAKASDPENCGGGPLYQYAHYERRFYYGGGRSLNEHWRFHNCVWQAQDPTCSATC